MSDLEESIRLDQEIANRLQNEHPEQFVTLVRMHLSFELDLNTDTENDPTSIDKIKNKKWKGFHKKAKACTSSKSTSPETTKSCLTKQNIRDVKQLINFLEQEQNICQEGIFRKTGSLSRQNELKNALVQGISINLENGDFTAHDCASVLKSFLNDLSEPLLMELYYPAYCQVAEFCHSKDTQAVREDRLLNAIQLLFLLLPKENNLLLKYLIEMLYKTIQHEATNKMSADNLATLFTPHLICPRTLSPEALHVISQQMCSIISFMIKTGSKLFHIPPKLATDIRAFFVERKRRKTMSPEHILNESITSDSVANTVYTFVDREKTAEAHVMNSTDTALAQLYAHIQSLPESSKKKKLIKQFNRENGHGTPLQVLMLREKNSGGGGSTVKGPKSIGDSIKRHIFHKSLMSKTPKRNSHTPVSFQTPNGTVSSVPKQRVLFQSPLSSGSSSSPSVLGKRCSTTSTSSSSSSSSDGDGMATSSTLRTAMRRSSSSVSTTSAGSYRCEPRRTVEFADIIVETDDECGGKRCRLSTAAEDEDEEPLAPVDDEDFVEQDDDDIGEDGLPDAQTLSDTEEDRFCCPSEAGLSDSRSKFKSEPNLSTIVHEETRKEKKISFLKNKLIKGVSMGNLRLPFGQESRSAKKSSSSSSLLKCCFEDSLKDGKKPSIASVASPDCRLIAATSASSLFGQQKSTSAAEEFDQINMLNENHGSLDANGAGGTWNVGYLTSTPAISGRDSMSPITKSTQRMPKSMQESIMTPRSRKPVMLLAGMNALDQHSTYAISQSSFSSLREEDEEDAAEVANPSACHQAATVAATVVSATSSSETSSGATTSTVGHGTDEEASSLTSTFREYLLSRSVLTDSPADLSFSSHPDDFDSSADLGDLNESKLSESLLFCLDGNRPADDDSQATLVNIRKRHSAEGTNEGDTISLKKLVLPTGTELDETSL